MKQVFLSALISLVTILGVNGQTASNSKSDKYNNNIYKFRVEIPSAWKLYGQVLNDTLTNSAIADWGLPPVYSDLEKTDIENSISVRAYKRSNIQSLSQLVSFEQSRMAGTNTIMKEDVATPGGYIINYTSDGLKYKGKAYFEFRNGIGYIVAFMATPGTFDKNLPVFESFFRSIKYLER